MWAFQQFEEWKYIQLTTTSCPKNFEQNDASPWPVGKPVPEELHKLAIRQTVKKNFQL